MPSNMTEKIMEGKCSCGFKFENENYCPECGMKNWFNIKDNEIRNEVIQYTIIDWGKQVSISVDKVLNPEDEDYYDDPMILKHTTTFEEAIEWINDNKKEHERRFLNGN